MLLHDFPGKAYRVILVSALALVLAGCFRPLYGQVEGGGNVATSLASIEVQPIQDRLGQERIGYYVHQELRFDLAGGLPVQKRYKLEMSLTESIQSPIVDTATGRADAATITADVTYTLREIGTNTVMTSGKATASATYDRNPQRFASIRAARDAEIRIAKTVADQIRTRLGAFLSTRV